MKKEIQISTSYLDNFSNREDLKQFGDNALLLYALQLKFGVEDIVQVATNYLVDGHDDKKVDLVYIDLDRNEAVIAQGYFSHKKRKEAPANKASDLNTAITWLLNRSIDEVPDKLQSVAKELRDFIVSGEIKRITVWYSHNLPKSKNVEQELKSVGHSLQTAIKTNYPGCEVEILTLEVGAEILDEWYKGLTTPILVGEKITIKNSEGFKLKEKNWESFSTYIPANKLYTLFAKHQTNLFSANVRDYLGSRKSDSNINNGIKTTAEKSPENFFVFNNGITALVNSFSYEKKSKELTINGFSIVNGAQTTGALGSSSKSPSASLLVPLRLIKCNDKDIIEDIVKFNNSQNKITAPDFRSNDEIQRRLRQEFEDLNSGLEYSARRGGSIDMIKRNPNLLPSVTAGQVLAAYHGSPAVAYNEKSKIWESDKLYSSFFNEHTTASHIFFTYSLLRSLERKKWDLINKEKSEEIIKSDEELLSYFRTRGSVILFITAISKSLEEIIEKPIPNLFGVRFCKPISLEKGIETWDPIVDVLSSFSNELKSGLKDGIKNQESINSTIKQFSKLVRAVKSANSASFKTFSKSVCL